MAYSHCVNQPNNVPNCVVLPEFSQEMHEGNGQRDECHMRLDRFTQSDFCVDLRVNEARAQRAIQDALDAQEEAERRDDKDKARAAKDARDAANAADAIVDQLTNDLNVAVDVRMDAEHAQQVSVDERQNAKNAVDEARELLEQAQRFLAGKEAELDTAQHNSDMANAAFEMAQGVEGATAAALTGAQADAVRAWAEFNRLDAIAEHS